MGDDGEVEWIRGQHPDCPLSKKGQYSRLLSLQRSVQPPDLIYADTHGSFELLPGRVKEKVEPCPCPSDSTQILPPCTSTMRLASARPMPGPCVPGSSFSNSSNIL